MPPVKMSEERPAWRSAIGSRACKTCRVIMWALHDNICFDKWAVACKTYLGLSRGLPTKFLFRNFCQIKIQKSIIFKIKTARASPKHVFEKSCTIILHLCTTLLCIHRKRPQKCPKNEQMEWVLTTVGAQTCLTKIVLNWSVILRSTNDQQFDFGIWILQRCKSSYKIMK